MKLWSVIKLRAWQENFLEKSIAYTKQIINQEARYSMLPTSIMWKEWNDKKWVDVEVIIQSINHILQIPDEGEMFNKFDELTKKLRCIKPEVNKSHNNQQNKPCEVSGNSSQT